MRNLLTICVMAGFLLTVGQITSGSVTVNSGGWAQADYSMSLPGNAIEYQHTHAEAGFDIASGTPVSVMDDYTQPYSYAYASTSHSWGQSTADTSLDYLRADNYASADTSVPESWGYGSTVYRVDFTLDAAATIDIGYTFNGYIFVDSYHSASSGFSTGLLSVWIDDNMVYDSDPEWDDYVEVTGVGFSDMILFDSGTIAHEFAAGSHEIAFFVDTYENAAGPIPAPGALLLGGLGAGLFGWLRGQNPVKVF